MTSSYSRAIANLNPIPYLFRLSVLLAFDLGRKRSFIGLPRVRRTLRGYWPVQAGIEPADTDEMD